MSELVFSYRAIGADGAVVSGEVGAVDRDQAIQALRRRGQLPIDVAPRAGWRLQLGGQRALGPRRAAALFAALAMLLQSGVPLDQALALLAGPDEDPAVTRCAARLRSRVQGGASLSVAMADAGESFDPVALAMIRAGEEGGQLAAAAAAAATQLETARLAGEKARAALVYPAMVLAAALLTLVLIATVVAPAFLPLFADRGATPPLPLALLAGAGGAVATWWPAMVLLAVGGWIGLRFLRTRPALRLACHTWILALPRVGRMLAAAEIGRFSQALGGLLAAGVRLPQALALAHGVLRNAALAADIASATQAVRAGGRLAASLGTVTHLPPVARHLLAVGEQSGRLAPSLLRIADLCQRQVQQDTERAMVLLGPALVIVLGGIVALVIATLLGAVLDANQLVM